MNNLNYIFFEEFKRLEKLCNDIYQTSNGVTHYIDDMNAVSYIDYRNIPNWKTDLNQLKNLRHIRNNLAHVEGTFDENVCTQNDIEWIRNFYKRILNQSDPLAIQYQNKKAHTQASTPLTPPKTEKIYCQTNTPKNSSPLKTIIIFIITLFILVFLAVLMAIYLIYT